MISDHSQTRCFALNAAGLFIVFFMLLSGLSGCAGPAGSDADGRADMTAGTTETAEPEPAAEESTAAESNAEETTEAITAVEETTPIPASLSPAEEARLLEAARAALDKQMTVDTGNTLFLDRVGGYYACTMPVPEGEDVMLLGSQALSPVSRAFGYEVNFSRVDMGNVWQVYYIVSVSQSEDGEPLCEVVRYYTKKEYLAGWEGFSVKTP